ncbi:MAG TPA: DNA-formamidopyrimidine glycosylase [Firmicutes bacterium]|nr:DNA-formamidopyrimidine glycosylase [Bacillota bacterium]
MPELPEVETVRRSLLPVILDKTITGVSVHYKRILRDISVRDFQTILVNNRFLDLKRRGKYLLFTLTGDWVMVAHLRMTGRLIYVSNREIPQAEHTSAAFDFADGSALRFEDVRKFATLNLVPAVRLQEIGGLHTLGVEPLAKEFTPELLGVMLKKSTAQIKGWLLDQKRIAGLGNIYSDECLFLAGIHPQRPANSLSKQETAKLHEAIVHVLQDAIENQGTTLRDYRTGYGREGSFQNKLLVYGRKEEECPRCGTDLKYKKVVGRTSHYCPRCQKE